MPESLDVRPAFKGDAEFRFNEIVSEGTAPNFGLGTGDLERLLVLSPSNDVPTVKWKRSRIAVRPKEGWQPNRVYRVELLPGLMDLANNRTKEGRVITFTTGAPLPTRFLAGRVVDWATSRAQGQALVEAMLLPDSLRYRTTADSAGRFRFGPLPDGDFLVAGVLDQNRNNRLDPRESFDTTRVLAGRDSVGELWAFRHDTVAARIQAVSVNDSMSISLAMNQQFDPYQQFVPDSFRVLLLPDSTAVPIDTVVVQAAYDSLFRARAPVDTAVSDSARLARQLADSLAQIRTDSVARADSVRRAAEARRRNRDEPQRPVDEGPLKTRPPLFDRVIIRLREPLVPGARYAVAVRGAISVSGVASDAVLGLLVPERKAPSTTAPADTAARPDTSGVRPDTAATPPDTMLVRRGTAGVRRTRRGFVP